MSEDGTNSVSDSSGNTRTHLPEARPKTLSGVRFTPGTLLGLRYRIVAPLGAGGMGEVYRADDLRLGQPIALKFLPVALATDAGRMSHLVDEVRIGRQISHPNVCRLYDLAEVDGQHFLVMEYVDGEDLASLLGRIGRLPGDKALELARGLCAGLAAAHEKGVVHRDLKPANVMIDGHGHARVADFGLAALAGSATGMAGTLSYMAPEQLRGEGASLRSDVFALGLVLHEMLTGHRVFQASSMAELRALHEGAAIPSLSSGAPGVDPVFERVVLRCLARDPRDRPASARAVLALLPGGDPLDAAVLAGETPSPEMVAAASKVGDLRPGAAWSAFASGVLALLAITDLTGRIGVFRLVPLGKSPEVLVEQARQTLSRLSIGASARDAAFGFFVDDGLVDQLEKRHTRWDTRRVARLSPFRFYYRESPAPMVSRGWMPVLPWLGPPELGRVLRNSPPVDIPGMSEVILDGDGRLERLTAVPSRFEKDHGPWAEADWSARLKEAGFEAGTLRRAEPRWAAPVDSDSKAAWDAQDPDVPELQLHIEAAAYHGRPVYFEVQGPWVKTPVDRQADPAVLVVAKALVFLVALPLGAVVAMVAARNLRRGRGDRRGAFRLGLFASFTLMLAQSLRAHHTSLAVDEYSLIVAIVGQGCYGALAVWAIYLALEPALRRRWPHTLISWNRVLVGRFRDPLVGRDVLVGLLLGFGVILAAQAASLAPILSGRPPSLSLAVISSLTSSRHLAFFFLVGPCMALLHSLSLLFMLYLLHAVTGREWAARSLLFFFMFVPTLAVSGDSFDAYFGAASFAGLLLFALTRFGLLSSAVLLFTFQVVIRTPLTFDASAWYAARSFVPLGFFALMLLGAGYASLGGKPPFGKALLDEG